MTLVTSSEGWAVGKITTRTCNFYQASGFIFSLISGRRLSHSYVFGFQNKILPSLLSSFYGLFPLQITAALSWP